MTLLGSRARCVCGSQACVEVDGIVWLCEPCARIIETEFARSPFSSAPPSDGNAPAADPHPAPECAAGAILSNPTPTVMAFPPEVSADCGSAPAGPPLSFEAEVSSLEADWSRDRNERIPLHQLASAPTLITHEQHSD